MRTTLNIDSDVLEAARSLALARKVSIGKIISELVRKGLAPRVSCSERRGFPVFTVSPDAETITPEIVRRLDDEA